VRRVPERETKLEHGALAKDASGCARAAVGACDGYNDREAEAGAALPAGAGGVGASEPLEDAGQRLGGDAEPFVRDGDDHEVPLAASGELDPRVVLGVVDSVLEQRV